MNGHFGAAASRSAEQYARLRLADSLRRTRRNSLLRNSVYIMGTTVVTSVLGYLYWVVAARTYSAHSVGLAAALISVAMLASIVSSIGLGSTLVQILPRRPQGAARSLVLSAGSVLGAIAALAGTALALLAVPTFSSELAVVDRGVVYAGAFSGAVLLTTFSMLLDYVFVAERAAGNMLARNVLFSAVKIPLLVVPFLVAAEALGILSSWVLASGVAAVGGVLLLLRLNRGYRPAVTGLTAEMRAIAPAFAGHHLINVGGLLPMYVLPMLVAVRLSPTANAYFYATWMAGGLFFMVSSGVASALFAEASHARNELARAVRSSALIIAALIVPPMLLFLVAGERIMGLFGPSYSEHAFPLLALLVASAVPEAVVSVFVSVLRVQRRFRFAALLTLGIAAIVLALTWVLLPALGIAGAGWAWLAAQITGTAIVFGEVTRGRRRRVATGSAQCAEPHLLKRIPKTEPET